MISKKLLNRSELAKQAVQKSALTSTDKDILNEMIEESLQNTNGISPEEKIQNLTENTFSLLFLFIAHITKDPHVTSWKDLIIACKRETLIGLIAILIALIVQPGLVKIFEMFM